MPDDKLAPVEDLSFDDTLILSSMASPTRHVLLLRGINVGGKQRLPMDELRKILAPLGATDVRTYIQSGNAVYSASLAAAKALPGQVEKAIKDRFGFVCPAIVRTAKEMDRIVSENPFLGESVDPNHLHVAFLSSIPNAANASSFDETRSPGDHARLIGRTLYLQLPNGVAATKLTNRYVDSVFDCVSTFRNWRTVLKLNRMLKQKG